ncbi:MAG: N-acetylmuramoyl-L-alanine amidase [Devosia sp.]
MAVAIKNNRVTVGGAAVDFVKSPYTGGGFAATPKVVVMHFTYGGTAASSAQWFKSPDNPGSSAHVVVERDGTIIQCVPLDTIAWHAGKSHLRNLVGLNQFAFGIEMANWGYLKRTPDGWQTYTQKRISDPVLAIHPYGNPDGSSQPIGWEAYPEAQVRAAADIARALVDTFGIDEIVGHEDISRGRKWDPGPAFDLTTFRALVFGDRADDGPSSFEVNSAEGLNLRAGASTANEVIRLLANGTKVEIVERQGNWALVSVLSSNGVAEINGWVNAAFLK